MAEAGSKTWAQITYQISPPEGFNFSSPAEWPKWKRRFERFRMASGLNGKTGPEQINALVYTMGDEAEEIMAAFNVTDAQQADYSEILSRFESHFVIRKNPIYERAKFNQRIQGENETGDSFVTALHTLSEHCEYRTLREELIRDRLIVGLKNRKLSESLQMDADMTLAKAVERARQSEEVRKQQAILYKENNHIGELNSVEMKYKSKNRYKPTINTRVKDEVKGKISPKSNQYQKCRWCGKIPFHKREVCPAREKTCLKCKKKGHYIVVCRTKETIAKLTDEEDIFFIGGITDNKSVEDEWLINLKLGGVKLDINIDTGADVTVIPYKWFQENKPEGQYCETNKRLKGPGQGKLEVMGKIYTNLEYNKKNIQQDIYIVKGLSIPLLGKPAIREFKLIDRIYEVKSIGIEKEYPKLFTGLGLLKGKYKIRLKPGAIPYALYTPRRVPIPTMKKVKAELERMVKYQVITQVKEPTEWCAPMVVVPKANGEIRICVDLTQLNKNVLREHHPLPSSEHILAQMPGAKVFSKLDANSGFWQVMLEEESRKYTTFITPFGRYWFNRLPFGITSGPEFFQRQMTGILEGLVGVVCLADDILVWGVDHAEHNKNLKQVLQRLNQANVTLNKEKSKFSVSKIKFLGHLIDGEGIHPDPGKVEAIKMMDRPKNIEELRRFIGMVNYLARFISNMADHIKPLSSLLKKEAAWYWDAEQENTFQKLKDMLCSNVVLALYDPEKETILSTDASSYGLGAVLRQIQPDGTIRPVAYSSRTLNETESRYAQVEKECLGIVWACERLSDLLVGKQFHIETDHKPLIPILAKKQLDELSPRLQRLKMRMMRYTYTISYIPGKDTIAADALSRAPSSEEKEEDKELGRELEAMVRQIMEELPTTDHKLMQIKQAQKAEETIQTLFKYSQEGWPDKRQISPRVKQYGKFKTELNIQEGILMRNNRIVIPTSMRVEIMSAIHEGHMGISKCRSRAKSSVWWPGLSKEIRDLVTNCSKCIENRINPIEPLLPSKVPSKPWEKVGMDLFYIKEKWHLIVTDYFSRYPEVMQLNCLKTTTVVNGLRSIFSRHGVPRCVRSDNGPQFQVIQNSEFDQYAKEEGFVHVTSSPRYPKSNGLVEASVKTVKNRLKKSNNPYTALLAYRNTPLENGYSPSQLLMGRRLRSNLPLAESQLIPNWPNLKEVEMKERDQKIKQKEAYDHRHKTKTLRDLNSGEKVWITDLHRGGQVIKQADTPRSYVVETEKGTTVRRNRFHLIPSPNLKKQVEEDILGWSPPIEDKEDKLVKESVVKENVEKGKKEREPQQGLKYTRAGRIVKPPDRLNL